MQRLQKKNRILRHAIFFEISRGWKWLKWCHHVICFLGQIESHVRPLYLQRQSWHAVNGRFNNFVEHRRFSMVGWDDSKLHPIAIVGARRDNHSLPWRKQKNKLYQHRPQIAKTNFCVINVENSVTSARNSRQFVWMQLLRMGTQQWHHVHSPKVGRLPPPQPQHTTMAAMAPLPQTWPSLPFPAAWHTTMAPCNGTQQWHYIHSPKVGRNPPPPP